MEGKSGWGSRDRGEEGEVAMAVGCVTDVLYYNFYYSNFYYTDAFFYNFFYLLLFFDLQYWLTL